MNIWMFHQKYLFIPTLISQRISLFYSFIINISYFLTSKIHITHLSTTLKSEWDFLAMWFLKVSFHRQFAAFSFIVINKMTVCCTLMTTLNEKQFYISFLYFRRYICIFRHVSARVQSEKVSMEPHHSMDLQASSNHTKYTTTNLWMSKTIANK